jgi:hypothetical protein
MADTNPIVAALSEYIENRQFPLIGAIQKSPLLTASEVTQTKGVKTKTKMHFMTTTLTMLDGAGCDRATPTDTTTFTDKELEVANIDFAENLCLERMEGTWLQTEMKVGATVGIQEMPQAIASIYWEEKGALMAQILDTADWQGDTDSVVENLNKYDGWLKWIDAGSAVAGNTGGLTSITSGNIIAALQAMFMVIPTNIRRKPGLKICLPEEWYDLYCIALVNANLFHFVGSEGETKLFGTSVILRPTYGLNGSDRMILTYMTNLGSGIDGDGDTELTSRLDPVSLRRILIDGRIKRGTQIGFAEDIVEFTLAST